MNEKSLLCCFLWLWGLLPLMSVAQPSLSTYDPEPPALRHAWHENLGQLCTDGGLPVPEVRQYTTANPASFLSNEALSVVWRRVDTFPGTPDTSHRVDITFPGGTVAAMPIVEELWPGVEHYYLAHTPDGVEGVRSCARLVCREVWPGIDMHLYSNALGLKWYWWLRPGADGDQVRIAVSHADSVAVTLGGGLDIHSSLGDLHLERARIVEVQPNGSWQVLSGAGDWWEVAPGVYSVRLPVYDGQNALMVQVDQGTPQALTPNAVSPEWGTFYGGGDFDGCADLDVDTAGNMYVAGGTHSLNFPRQGPQAFPLLGGKEMFVGSFDTNYVRRWMVVYGGSGHDAAYCVTADNAAGRVYVGGSTEITSAPMDQHRWSLSTAYQESYQPPSTPWAGFIASFNAAGGERIWVTHLGGENASVQGMDTDDDGNLYAVGVTYEDSVQWSWGPTGGAFPLCGLIGSYMQTEMNPFFILFVTADGFIMKFDSAGHLRWSTPWGGDIGDGLYDVGVDGHLGQLWVVGASSSIDLGLTGCNITPVPTRPLCNAGGFFQTDLNSTNAVSSISDAMLLRFNLDGRLEWSSFMGHKFSDAATKLAVPNEPPIRGTPGPGGVYVVGMTASGAAGPNCSQNGTNGFPQCHTGLRYWQPYGGGYDDAFLAAFDAATNLRWCTFLGGGRRDGPNNGGFGPYVDVGPDGRVYFAGSTLSGAGPFASMPTLADPYIYDQSSHGDSGLDSLDTDGWLMVFSPAGEVEHWGYIGGLDQDYIQGMAVGRGGRILVGGYTDSDANFPLANPASLPGTAWYQDYPVQGMGDAFFAQVRVPLATQVGEPLSMPSLRLSPNPSGSVVNLDWKGHGGEALVVIHDLQGRQVAAAAVHEDFGRNHATVELATLPAGMYIVSVLTGSQVLSAILVRL